MISSSDKEKIKKLLETTQYKKANDVFNSSEYREMFNGEKLYNNMVKTESYVSKRSNDESEFWKGGKLAYDDESMKQNVLYKTINRSQHKEYTIPEKFKTTEHNMRVTRISEYSNALYNNEVFKNPNFLSC